MHVFSGWSTEPSRSSVRSGATSRRSYRLSSICAPPASTGQSLSSDGPERWELTSAGGILRMRSSALSSLASAMVTNLVTPALALRTQLIVSDTATTVVRDAPLCCCPSAPTGLAIMSTPHVICCVSKTRGEFGQRRRSAGAAEGTELLQALFVQLSTAADAVLSSPLGWPTRYSHTYRLGKRRAE